MAALTASWTLSVISPVSQYRAQKVAALDRESAVCEFEQLSPDSVVCSVMFPLVFVTVTSTSWIPKVSPTVKLWLVLTCEVTVSGSGLRVGALGEAMATMKSSPASSPRTKP